MDATQTPEEQYKASLKLLEKKACEIAENHLGTSFNMQKSIGYQKWSQEQARQQPQSDKQSESQS